MSSAPRLNPQEVLRVFNEKHKLILNLVFPADHDPFIKDVLSQYIHVIYEIYVFSEKEESQLIFLQAVKTYFNCIYD